MPNFSANVFPVVITVVRLIFNLSAISLLMSPLVIKTSTSISRADNSCSTVGTGGATSPDIRRDGHVGGVSEYL